MVRLLPVHRLTIHGANTRPQHAETSLATRTRQARKKAKKPASNPLESDYDSEEKLIIDLKKQGYKDDAIARQLVVEGYAELSAKRIQARWLKLKKKEDAKEEQRLDDELSDWHIGEVSGQS